MNPKNYVVIHHSLTQDSQTVSWNAIEEYHVKVNGWRDIGYHYGVEKGDKGYVALVGRPEYMDAAACPQGQMNQLGIHICVVGNFDLAPPPEEALAILTRRLIVPIVKRNQIPPGNIIGHRDRNPAKTCPGKLFDLEALRERVRKALGELG